MIARLYGKSTCNVVRKQEEFLCSTDQLISDRGIDSALRREERRLTEEVGGNLTLM